MFYFIQQNMNTAAMGLPTARVENVTSTVMPRTPSPLLIEVRSPSPGSGPSNNVTSSTQNITISNILAAAQQNALQNPQQQSQMMMSNQDHINLAGGISMAVADFSIDNGPGGIDKCSNGAEMELPSSSSGQQLIQQIQTLSHKGPCTPPPLTTLESESFDLTRGPQTPNDEPFDSYDPCDPTESPEANNDFLTSSKSIGVLGAGGDSNSINSGQPTSSSGENRNVMASNSWANNLEQGANSNTMDLIRGDINQNGDFINSRNSCGNTSSANSNLLAHSHQERDSLMKTAATAIPFLMEDHNIAVSSTKEKDGHDRLDQDQMDFPVDMDMDSPFSPQSSEMSDIFEPPLDTPLTNKKMSNAMKRVHKNVTSSVGRQQLGKYILYRYIPFLFW